MAAIVRDLTASFLAREHDRVAPQVRSTLQRLSYCRTAALGGHVYRCHSCQSRVPVYNSCGDRHCPQCRGARRADWVAQAAKVLQSQVKYFQVVFTLPEELSALLLGNRSAGYGLLFQAAWQALRESIEVECGYQAAATMMLHTWNQRLGHHPHVHALVAGNGPSLDGKSWVSCRQTRGTRSQSPRPFLVDNKRLGHRFRDRFLAGLRRLAQRGELQLRGDAELELLAELAERDWVVFIEGPPSDLDAPEQVLKYLARYMTGGPIGDRRLLARDERTITFSARASDKSGGQVPVQLPVHEFMRRWCLHILPKGFAKVRWFGCWSSQQKGNYQLLAQTLAPPRELSPVAAPDVVETEPSVELLAANTPACCPACQAPLTLEWYAPRPAWRELFYGRDALHAAQWVSTG